MKTQTLNWIAVAAVVLASGCGVIPKAYRGTFQEGGAKLQLGSSEGTFTDMTGRVIQAKADELKFDNLAKGEAGIYLSMNTVQDGLVEVYWVNPDVKSRQEGAGLIWFDSEVIYTRMDSNQDDAAKMIEFYHCANGNVLLDAPTQRFEIGCPPDVKYYRMTRTGE